MGVAIGYTNIVAISWLQARVDGAMTGRVMSLVMLMSFGITPLSLACRARLIDSTRPRCSSGRRLLVVLTAPFAVAVRFPRCSTRRPSGHRRRPIRSRPLTAGNGAASTPISSIRPA